MKTFAETKEEYLDIQRWMAGYVDAIRALDLECREDIISAHTMLREMPGQFYDRFIAPFERRR